MIKREKDVGDEGRIHDVDDSKTTHRHQEEEKGNEAYKQHLQRFCDKQDWRKGSEQTTKLKNKDRLTKMKHHIERGDETSPECQSTTSMFIICMRSLCLIILQTGLPYKFSLPFDFNGLSWCVSFLSAVFVFLLHQQKPNRDHRIDQTVAIDFIILRFVETEETQLLAYNCYPRCNTIDMNLHQNYQSPNHPNIPQPTYPLIIALTHSFMIGSKTT